MTVAASIRALSLDDAIQQGVNAAMDGESVAEIATTLWQQGLDGEAADVCGAIGLRTLIHARLGASRHPADDGEAAEDLVENERVRGRPVANIHYAKEHWRKILAGNYETADGTRKALLAFTHEDAAYLRSLAGSRADGYLRLRDAMDAAVALLKRRGATATIGDLPEKAQRKIAEALS